MSTSQGVFHMKRLVAFLLVLVLALTGPVGAFAAEFNSASRWAREDLNTCLQLNIIPSGMLNQPMNQPITRLEFCQSVMLVYEKEFGNYSLKTRQSPYPDSSDRSVLAASELDIVRGYPDGTFRPDALITRQEVMVMLYRLIRIGNPSFTGNIYYLSNYADGASVGSWAKVEVSAMVGYGICKGMSATTIVPQGTTTREQALVLMKRIYQTDVLSNAAYSATLQSFLSNPLLTTHKYADSYNMEKHRFIFGSTSVSRMDEDAVNAMKMVNVTIPIWLLKNGQKVASTTTVKVNEKLADVVRAIFNEIFTGSEKFPIYSVGGYRGAPSDSVASDHRVGVAIDINPGANPEMSKTQDPYTKGYRPGENPYSIPPDGDVVRAFNRYGFFWAGEGWSRKYDFMHFSFFGT